MPLYPTDEELAQEFEDLEAEPQTLGCILEEEDDGYVEEEFDDDDFDLDFDEPEEEDPDIEVDPWACESICPHCQDAEGLCDCVADFNPEELNE